MDEKYLRYVATAASDIIEDAYMTVYVNDRMRENRREKVFTSFKGCHDDSLARSQARNVLYLLDSISSDGEVGVHLRMDALWVLDELSFMGISEDVLAKEAHEHRENTRRDARWRYTRTTCCARTADAAT